MDRSQDGSEADNGVAFDQLYVDKFEKKHFGEFQFHFSYFDIPNIIYIHAGFTPMREESQSTTANLEIPIQEVEELTVKRPAISRRQSYRFEKERELRDAAQVI